MEVTEHYITIPEKEDPEASETVFSPQNRTPSSSKLSRKVLDEGHNLASVIDLYRVLKTIRQRRRRRWRR